MKWTVAVVNRNIVKKGLNVDESEYWCPYCAQPNTLEIDPTGGRRQQFTTDCEVCCRPIRITLVLDADGSPMIDAEAELSSNN